MVVVVTTDRVVFGQLDPLVFLFNKVVPGQQPNGLELQVSTGILVITDWVVAAQFDPSLFLLFMSVPGQQPKGLAHTKPRVGTDFEVPRVGTQFAMVRVGTAGVFAGMN